MATKFCLKIAFMLSFVLVCTNANNEIFNVLSYGAKADGATDDSEVRIIKYMQFFF